MNTTTSTERQPAEPSVASPRSSERDTPGKVRKQPPWVAGVAVALLGALGVLVGLGFDRVFFDAPVLKLGLLASLGAIAVGELVGRLWHGSTSTTLLTSLVACVIAAPVVVFAVAPTPNELLVVVNALLDAPRQILSVPLPVTGSPELTVVAFIAVWAAVALGIELARRRPGPFLPLAPFAAAMAVPVVLAAAGMPPSNGYWAVVLVAAGSFAVTSSAGTSAPTIRSVRSAQALQRRRILGGLTMVAVVAVVVPSMARRAPGVADRPRVDPRSTPVTNPVRVDSPLARVAEVRRGSRETAFTAQGDAGVTRWRLAVLDEYDGASWSAGSSLVQVAEQFPELPAQGRQVSFDVELGSTGTIFLPMPGNPSSVAGPPVRLDPTTGNVVLDDPPDAVEGVTYRVQATVADVSAAERDRAVAVRGAAIDVGLVDGDAADGLAVLRRQAEEQVASVAPDPSRSPDANRLLALADFVSDDQIFAIEDDPTSGESVAQLQRLIVGSSGTDDEDRRSGSHEQFVAAYAVMARSLGFQSRVVVGYRPTDEAGTVTATSAQIDSWAEVNMEGLGWVSFDVGPDATQDAEPVAPEEPEPVEADDPPPPTDSTDGDLRPDIDEAPSSSQPPWLLLAAVAVAVMAAVSLLRRPVRRRLRQRGDERRRVLGAWAEASDVLARAGVSTDRTRTVGEVTDAAQAVLSPAGRTALAHLGGLATRASWSPASVEPSMPEAAWADLAEVRRHLVVASKPWARRKAREVGE